MDVARLCLFLFAKVHVVCMGAGEHTGNGTCMGMWVDALVVRCAYMWMQAGGKQRSKNSSINLHVCNIGSGIEALNHGWPMSWRDLPILASLMMNLPASHQVFYMIAEYLSSAMIRMSSTEPFSQPQPQPQPQPI